MTLFRSCRSARDEADTVGVMDQLEDRHKRYLVCTGLPDEVPKSLPSYECCYRISWHRNHTVNEDVFVTDQLVNMVVGPMTSSRSAFGVVLGEVEILASWQSKRKK